MPAPVREVSEMGAFVRGQYVGHQVTDRRQSELNQLHRERVLVVQSFGAPNSRIDRPDGTSTWKWCQSRTESSSGHVLLLWDRDNSRTTTRCTSVELRSGVVAAVHNE